MSNPRIAASLSNNLADENLNIDTLAATLRQGGLVVGLLGLLATIFLTSQTHDGGKQFFHSYLLGLMYFLSISLGALFFVILQHLTRAGWSVVVRRVAEILAANLPVMVLLFMPIVVPMLRGNAQLYHWVDVEAVAHDALLKGKSAYLNVPFFAIRCGIYALVWTFLSRYFLRQSVSQDHTQDATKTVQMQRASAVGMLLFALTLTFCAFDLLMSLEPHWFSTMFGVYYFAGSVLSFLATLILITMGLQNTGRLQKTVTVEHFHDMGKLLFGFVFFWGYIAFSQYMLIWYGDIPEETEWLLERQQGEWMWVSLLLLFGHFILPFAGLISRHVKRSRRGLAFWCGFLLTMHWVDLYWLVMPSLQTGQVPWHLLDITCWLTIAGIFVATLGFTARGKSVLAIGDPRLPESLAFENM